MYQQVDLNKIGLFPHLNIGIRRGISIFSLIFVARLVANSRKYVNGLYIQNNTTCHSINKNVNNSTQTELGNSNINDNILREIFIEEDSNLARLMREAIVSNNSIYKTEEQLVATRDFYENNKDMIEFGIVNEKRIIDFIKGRYGKVYLNNFLNLIKFVKDDFYVYSLDRVICHVDDLRYMLYCIQLFKKYYLHS